MVFLIKQVLSPFSQILEAFNMHNTIVFSAYEYFAIIIIIIILTIKPDDDN